MLSACDGVKPAFGNREAARIVTIAKINAFREPGVRQG